VQGRIAWLLKARAGLARLTEASLHRYSYLSNLSGSSFATLRAGK
jgi:hypothetical protein